MEYGFRHLHSFLWYRNSALRWLHRSLIRRGFRYHTWDETEYGFLHVAVLCSPSQFKRRRKTIPVEELEIDLKDNDQWHRVRGTLNPDDRVWPFAINVDTMAMRLGYVVIRNGKPITAIVKVMS